MAWWWQFLGAGYIRDSYFGVKTGYIAHNAEKILHKRNIGSVEPANRSIPSNLKTHVWYSPNGSCTGSLFRVNLVLIKLIRITSRSWHGLMLTPSGCFKPQPWKRNCHNRLFQTYSFDTYLNGIMENTELMNFRTIRQLRTEFVKFFKSKKNK